MRHGHGSLCCHVGMRLAMARNDFYQFNFDSLELGSPKMMYLLARIPAAGMSCCHTMSVAS